MTTSSTTAPSGADGALGRCVGEVDAFLRRAFGREPHRASTGSFDDLLSLADTDRILTGSGARRPAVRLVRDGDVLDPSTWTRRARTGAVWIDDLVHPGRVVDEVAGGATVALQSLHRWWPPLTAFCRDLELALGHATQANAYLTPAGAAGLAPHHDTHDVFVLQVHGQKDWVVRSPVLVDPLPHQRSDHEAAGAQEPLFECTLRPGDCLYLPRGFVHSARAQEGASLHLTIGLLATTARDVLQRLIVATADDARFRRTMPPGFGTDAAVAAKAVQEVVADLISWLQQADTEPVADAFVRSFTEGRGQLLDGHLLEVLRLHEIDDGTLVRRRGGAPQRLDVEADRLTIAVADRRIHLPAALEPAVRRVLDGEAHRVADLGDAMDAGSRLVLVRRLVREGVLRVVDGG